MLLDTRTLFAIDSMAYVALAVAILVLWRDNRGEAGLRELFFGLASLALGLGVLGILRGLLPDGLTVVVGNTFLVGGVVLCADGVGLVYGRTPPPWRAPALLAVTVAALLYLLLVQPSVAGRVVLVSGMVGFRWLAAAVATARGLGKPRVHLPSLLTLLGLGGLGVLHLGRAASVIAGSRADTIHTGAMMTNFILATDVLGSIVWVFSVIALVNRRLNASLAATAESLATSEARARSLIQNAPDAIVILDAETGLFTSHNPAARELLGCTEEEMDRLGPVDLSPRVQPDGRLSKEKAPELIRRALDGEMPIFEWMHERPSGEPVLCEVRLLRLPTSSGALLRGSMVDISERKRAERQRERERTLLEVAQSLAQVGHWTWETGAERVACSAGMRQILGLPPGTPLTFGELRSRIHAADQERVIKATRVALESGKAYELRYRISRADGSLRWIDARGSLERDSSGKTPSLIEVAQDVTERVQLEEDLRRAEMSAALARLVAGTAHEVRNPLFAISATVDAFAASVGEVPEYEGYVSHLRREVDRLAAVLQQLIEYGKPLSEQFLPGTIQDVVADARKECATLATDAGVELRAEVSESLPPVPMDRPALGRALANVIQNALQHSPPGGAVSVRAAERRSGNGAWLEVQVSDGGPGFSPTELDHAFEPFFTTRRGGTGLGLSIVQRILEAHGGHVEASNGPGGGAQVLLAVPVRRR